jgi:hypothetical protein
LSLSTLGVRLELAASFGRCHEEYSHNASSPSRVKVALRHSGTKHYRKPIPSDKEIDAQVKQLRSLWEQDQAVRPYLRRHAQLFHDLLKEDWSWASLALALTKAGITHQTKKPWSASSRSFSSTPRIVKTCLDVSTEMHPNSIGRPFHWIGCSTLSWHINAGGPSTSALREAR